MGGNAMTPVLSLIFVSNLFLLAEEDWSVWGIE
jgi:hypothetical protein